MGLNAESLLSPPSLGEIHSLDIHFYRTRPLSCDFRPDHFPSIYETTRHNLRLAQTLFQPETRNTRQRVHRIASVVEPNLFDCCNALCIGKLFWLEVVVIFPRFFELFQEGPISNSHICADWKRFFVGSRFTYIHGVN